jgi:RHS repeat-associated protein
MPAGAGQLRVEFLRMNTGSAIDGLNVAYTIDNVSLTRLEPIYQQGTIVCSGNATPTGENGIYRYGFNGKENDNEVKGWGNQQDYGMRIYDPRLGRFLSVDPLAKSYPWNSPYAFAENDVLRNIDLDGEEKKHYLLVWDQQHRTASLQYSHTTDFVEVNSEWTPTWRNLLKFNTTIVKNPRVEYVVHGDVDVPKSESGMFENEVVAATWTFKSSEEMFAAERHRDKGRDSQDHDKPFEFSDYWFYSSTDQRWSIAFSQSVSYGMEAQAWKTVHAPNFSRFSNKLPVFPSLAKAEGAAAESGKYAFGLKNVVPKFAEEIGAIHLMKDPNWKSSFTNIINNSKNELHFTLNGIDQTPMQMILNPGRSGINWEMNTLYNSPAFENTIFHYGGNTYKGFEVLGIKP